MKHKNIAVIGSMGLVGSEILNILQERDIPLASLKLFDSEEHEGELYSFKGTEYAVEVLEEDSFKGLDYALFAVSEELACQYVPKALKEGVTAIDNSIAFRLKAEVPLVVPEVNFNSASGAKLISSPNCSTIQLVPVLNYIDKLAGLKRVVVSTYQAVSGAGKAAMDELWEQTRAVFTQQDFEPEAFKHQIAFNCIPQIDLFLDDGYTREEYKLIDETRKILAKPDLKITATAVRVPIFNGHSLSVNVETEKELSPENLIATLEKAEEIKAYPKLEDFPMAVNAANDDLIHVGRIRQDRSVDAGLAFWVVADNLRKGAALNVVQILEKLLSNS